MLNNKKLFKFFSGSLKKKLSFVLNVLVSFVLRQFFPVLYLISVV